MSKRTPKALREDYARMNKSWPEDLWKRDWPSFQELKEGARRLTAAFRPARPRLVCDITETTGNRWTRFMGRQGLKINRRWGWPQLVHCLSHHFSNGHNQHHLEMEWRMIKHVRESGWLEGKLKREPPPRAVVPLKERRAAKAKKLLERAQKDAAAAQARVRRWKKTVQYYEKTLQPTPT